MTMDTEELQAMAEGRRVFSHKDGLALATEVLEWRKGQSYRYVGADGKTVLARDMEDELIAARAKIEAAEKLAEAARAQAKAFLLWAHKPTTNKAEASLKADEAFYEALTAWDAAQ